MLVYRLSSKWPFKLRQLLLLRNANFRRARLCEQVDWQYASHLFFLREVRF